MSYNLFFNNFEDSDFKSKNAKVNMKKLIKLKGTTEIDFKNIKEDLINRFLVNNEKMNINLSYEIDDNNIKITAIKTLINNNRGELRKKLRDKLKNKRTDNLIHNQRKAYEESQRMLKQNKKMLVQDNIKKNNKVDIMTTLFNKAKSVIKNKEVPSPEQVSNNKDKYINEIFEHVLFLSQKCKTRDELIEVMKNDYINYLQTVLNFDYTKYLDQFFRKLKDHSHSNVPKMVDDVKDNIVNEDELNEEVKKNLQDSESDENNEDNLSESINFSQEDIN
tara:strand:+ start:3205 stop:4035 length:831 start_codon:yes stop_codon:yes gene_type:complete